MIDNIGSMYQIGMLREINEMNLLAGPWLFVLQQVVRLESGLGAGDALQLQRNYWITQGGYQPSKAGPNDGGTFSLEKTDDGVTIYLLGFIKENMIIITGAGGMEGIVSYAGGARAGVDHVRSHGQGHRALTPTRPQPDARPFADWLSSLHNAGPASSAGLTVPPPAGTIPSPGSGGSRR